LVLNNLANRQRGTELIPFYGDSGMAQLAVPSPGMSDAAASAAHELQNASLHEAWIESA
jgi:hypothetical protein